MAATKATKSPSLRESMTMENEWARRVEEAKWRYLFAKSHLDELMKDPSQWDKRARIAEVRQITAALKREYARVLDAFSDLVIDGATPRVRWR
jgi:hypothetical protein